MTEHQVSDVPCALDAEAAVLSLCLTMGRDMVSRVSNIIRTDDMYSRAHAVIYGAILDAHKRGLVPDVLVVAQSLRDAGKIDEAGGVAYITTVINAAPGTANVAHYADIVAKKSHLRKLISACSDIAARAKAEHGEDEKFISDAGARVHEICRISSKSGLITGKEALTSTFLEIQNANARGSDMMGLSSGISSLDAVLGGIRNSGLLLVAARPSEGKTALLLNIACAAIMRNDGVLFFSLEMGKSSIMHRLIAQVSEIDSEKLERGQLDKLGWQKVTAAVGKLANLPFKIDDTTDLTASQIRQRVLAGVRDGFIERRPIKLICVDYAQRIRSEDVDRRAPRYEQVGRNIEAIKAVAKEVDLPIVTAAQLRRAADGKKEIPPTLESLRESGDLEQAADQVLAIWKKPNDINMLILKNRFGRTNSIRVKWEPEFTRFGDYV